MAGDREEHLDFDALQRLWCDQPLPSTDREESEMIDQAIRQARRFERRILIRDLLEIALSVGMAGLFLFSGLRMATSWPWFVAALLVFFVGAFFVGDRIRQRRTEEPAESVRGSLERSLQRLEHQIWLLRRVGWWYLTPCFLAGVVIVLGVGIDLVGEVQGRGLPVAPWVAVLGLVAVGAVLMTAVCWGIYRANQKAVECILEPRRDRLAGLLGELEGGEGSGLGG